ncbi:Stress responsive A/B barrel domain-containing protein [Mycena venus]|uniref:Stress responsive A/B barrel domain-containing protein n=1 Tax=Mycena venus TaxID=2733690 RepID=A0A8H6YLL7_9AGAR|nr:Stress responsive A/B barrel domain-containing protein [Mycena venus]
MNHVQIRLAYFAHQPLESSQSCTPVVPMSLIHIVMFQFKADASPESVEEACARMLSLKDDCIHPESQKPYIKSLTGGKDNSPEGKQNGIQYAFVVEFESTADRDYYVATDPTHQAFVKSVGAVVQKAIVVDYTVGHF